MSYRTGEIAAAAAISVEAVRYYERQVQRLLARKLAEIDHKRHNSRTSDARAGLRGRVRALSSQGCRSRVPHYRQGRRAARRVQPDRGGTCCAAVSCHSRRGYESTLPITPNTAAVNRAGPARTSINTTHPSVSAAGRLRSATLSQNGTPAASTPAAALPQTRRTVVAPRIRRQ
jgi:hypothetical protein